MAIKGLLGASYENTLVAYATGLIYKKHLRCFFLNFYVGFLRIKSYNYINRFFGYSKKAIRFSVWRRLT